MNPAHAPLTSLGGDRQFDERPGTEGIWTFVFLDMLVFGLLFLVYLSERHRLHALFAASQHHLNPLVGLVSTLCLLTSSWCMAEAVQAVRSGAAPRAGRWMTLALLFGVMFVGNKLFEYAGKFQAGLSPATNSFFSFYFVITGVHFAHVVGGLAFILSLRLRLASSVGTVAYRRNAENVGLFWHFVDVLWLFIFPMLYLTELA